MNTSRAPLPLPVRLAAGIVATATEQAKWFPSRVIGLPVTVISHALQLSMRLQQQMTALAIKGDDALSGLRPAQETPSWATFDEDAPAATQAQEGKPPLPGEETTQDTGTTGSALRMLHDEHTAPVIGSIGLAATQPRDSTGPEATGRDQDTGDDCSGGTAGAAQSSDAAEDPWTLETKELTREHADGEGDSGPADAPPTCFPNYDELSLPQLRARLRRFTLADLHELLDYERAHAARAQFVTMLARRIDTVRAEQ